MLKISGISNPLILFTYVLIIYYPIFQFPGPLLQADQPLWTTITHLLHTEVFQDQQWFWNIVFDQGSAGKNMGKNYSTVLILPWLLTYFFSAATAVKVSLVISTLFLLLSFYYVCKLYVPPAYALLCSLTVVTPMFKHISYGMWYNTFSIACGMFFWVSCHYYRKNRSWLPFSGGIISVAFATYSHPIGLILCGTLLVTYLILTFTDSSSRKISVAVIMSSMVLLGLMCAFPQVMATFGLDSGPNMHSGSLPSYGVERLTTVLEKLFIFSLGGTSNLTTAPLLFYWLIKFLTVVLFFIGCFAVTQKRHRKVRIILGCIFTVTAILISRVYSVLNIDFAIFTMLAQYSNRFTLLANIYLILLSALGITYLADNARKNSLLNVLYVILLGNLICVILLPLYRIYIVETKQLATIESSIIAEEAFNLWDWLNNNVQKDTERIYFEDSYGRFEWNESQNLHSNRTHIFALTGIYTNIRQVGGWCGFGTVFDDVYERGAIFSKEVDDDDFNEQFILSRMKLLNCRFLVVYSKNLIAKLTHIKSLVNVATFGSFHIFENTTMQPAWAWNKVSGNHARMVRHSSSHFEIITDGHTEDEIFVSMAYYPNYIAEIDTTRLKIKNHNQLMSVRLPGEGVQSIHFKYTFRKGIALAVMGIGMCLSCLGSLFLLSSTGRRYFHS